jgi:glycosyltransferase involved in cell wall biosynthesis
MEDYLKYEVLILDMQPIDPPIGGGRIRLLGLYHNLGEYLPAKYIGSYDWKGEKFRDHNLSKTLREIDIPLSEEHFKKVSELQKLVNNKTVIDIAFHKFAYLSGNYTDYVNKEIAGSDVIIFSHPWVYPLVKDKIDKKRQLVIYDSQNVEGFLRYSLIAEGEGETENELVKEIVRVEYDLCRFSDLIFVCSHEDRQLFNRLYSVPFAKTAVVNNGVFVNKIKPSNIKHKSVLKEKMKLPAGKAALFIGSGYPPNIEAANFILNKLAPEVPEVFFIVAGSVGDALMQGGAKPPNVKITGVISEADKIGYLSASDFAINPMFSGSGTNIKMFDFMAAGLPVITTETGARGIARQNGGKETMLIAGENDFAAAVRMFFGDEKLSQSISDAALELVREKYSFETISKDIGGLIYNRRSKLGKTPPFFSVIIPSYERHLSLDVLLKSLSEQTFKDFEIIIVDQSDKPFDGISRYSEAGMDIYYIHTHIKGAVKARNTGALYARGRVLAFTDDDCVPTKEWLEEAYKLFNNSGIIGVEGIVKSSELNNIDYRTVTNEGFKTGIGFMTANLFLQREVFNAINGFDEEFDNPHFREDTDLAWRALEYGEISFSNKAEVFHPPHKRDIKRESSEERGKFFEKDALLLKKHPKKYMELFLLENHWQNTPGFWENFLRGAEKYGIDINEYEIIKYYIV